MINPALLVAALSCGLALGIFVFGGLWWTVRRGLASSSPALWLGFSALLRLAIVFSTFYYMALTGLPSVIACLLGLLAARYAVARVIRSLYQGRPCD
jgi:F1F0 ATPase subunit 2